MKNKFYKHEKNDSAETIRIGKKLFFFARVEQVVWFRLFGYGIHRSPFNVGKLLFGERYGYAPFLVYHQCIYKLLTRKDAGFKTFK